MPLPLVTIAIISYNQAEFIDAALKSALEQDYEALEVVAADDGSTDGTAEIIQGYAARYPGRLVALTGGPNLGVTGNSNRALAACRGQYVAFQGGDDILLPGKIAAQAAWLEADPNRVLCTHDVEIFDSDTGETIDLWSRTQPFPQAGGLAWVVRRGVPCAATAAMLRRSALPEYGFDQRGPVVSDWKLYIDALAGGGAFGAVGGVFARYRISRQNVSKNIPRMVRDRLVIAALVESELPQAAPLARFPRASALYDLGIYWMKQGQPAKARALFAASLLSARTSPRQAAAWALSLLPPAFSRPLLADRATPRRWTDFFPLGGKRP